MTYNNEPICAPNDVRLIVFDQEGSPRFIQWGEFESTYRATPTQRKLAWRVVRRELPEILIPGIGHVSRRD